LNLSQRPKPGGIDVAQVTSTLELERGEGAEELGGVPTDTLARDHFTRAPLVVVSTQEREAVVGEEEGPSEEVPINELMIRPEEKVVKRETIEEEWAVKGNLTVDITEVVLGDLSPAEPVSESKEVLFNQEWVELCE